MAAGVLHGSVVVERDEVGVHAGVPPVDQHRGLAMQRDRIDHVAAAPQRVEDEAVDLVARQRVDGLALALAFVAEVEQHHEVARVLAGLLGAAQHRHRIRVGDVGHDQADEPRTAMAQRLRHRARRILQRCDGDLDARGDVGAQQPLAVVEEARDGGLGNACRFGDVGNGGAARGFHARLSLPLPLGRGLG
jgi:hypothetical protein